MDDKTYKISKKSRHGRSESRGGKPDNAKETSSSRRLERDKLSTFIKEKMVHFQLKNDPSKCKISKGPLGNERPSSSILKAGERRALSKLIKEKVESESKKNLERASSSKSSSGRENKIVEGRKRKTSSRENTSNTTVANDRLESLRKRLSLESTKDEASVPNKRSRIVDNSQPESEPMDYDCIVEAINQVRNNPDGYRSKVKPISSKKIPKTGDISYTIVIDTNILLKHISIIDEILKDKPNYVVMIPWRVFCELDNLKKCKRVMENGQRIDVLARDAINYLHRHLPSNDRLIGQSLKDTTNLLFRCEVPDDEILNCCMQAVQTSKNAILLTNDKNLYLKANLNNVRAQTYDEFNKFLWMGEIVSRKTNDCVVNNDDEVASVPVPPPEDKNPTLRQYSKITDILKEFFSVVLEEEMKTRYEDLWLNIVFKKPPWTIHDVLESISKHWIAVFSEILPKSAKNMITNINYYFPRRRKMKTLTSEDIDSLISSSVDLIKYLQFDSKKPYFKLAGDSLRSLTEINSKTDGVDIKESEINREDEAYKSATKLDESRNMESEDEIILGMDPNESLLNTSQYSNEENNIVDVLAFIWNGLTSFCCRLANTLKVAHSFDDKIAVGNLFELIPQANSVENQISLIVKNFSRILTCNTVESTSPEYMKLEANEAAESFHIILTDTIIGMGRQGLNFDKVQLFAFCSKHKSVLEDGFNKFKMLHTLLMECAKKYSDAQMQM